MWASICSFTFFLQRPENVSNLELSDTYAILYAAVNIALIDNNLKILRVLGFLYGTISCKEVELINNLLPKLISEIAHLMFIHIMRILCPKKEENVGTGIGLSKQKCKTG